MDQRRTVDKEVRLQRDDRTRSGWEKVYVSFDVHQVFTFFSSSSSQQYQIDSIVCCSFLGSDHSHSFFFAVNSPKVTHFSNTRVALIMQFFSTVVAVSALAGMTVATPWGPGSSHPTLPTVKYSTSVKVTLPSTSGHLPVSVPSYTSAPTSTKSYSKSTSTSTTTSTAAKGTVTCLTSDTASYLVNGFASLLTNYNNATAEALLASDFTDTSDSINWLAGYPIGSTTFPSKQAFEQGQGSQPPIGFQLYSIDAVTCKVVAFRWAALLGGDPVKGINILYASNLNNTAQGWQIETNFSEFNSGLWLEEIGGVCTPPLSL